MHLNLTCSVLHEIPDVHDLLLKQRVTSIKKAINLSEAVTNECEKLINFRRGEIPVAARKAAMALDLYEVNDAPTEALVKVHCVDTSIFGSIRYASSRLVKIETQ
jgi:hypothetical protein